MTKSPKKEDPHMKDDVRAALEITPQAPTRDRTIDITTYGASSGMPRRIETWFHHVDGRWFLSGRPGRRDWYANLRKNPQLVVHLKHHVQADLPATAVLITDPRERRRIVTLILRGLEQMGGWTNASDENVQAWVAGSPLVEIDFIAQAQ
ncbi:nitroreductase/quinone reductase family protein [Occultella aeris]|nr:nitroreductase/quinone reductase family protein [Occultella aeris]